ncbi:winged helix-turn-helix domain-containing protein [Actinomadura kijaniata]|uniref:winged helix-turn-helix domain-containing protein n=1 Tax=Actinomadura kijaniata TaxID=46161 RepID=UPI00082BC46B|nr:helix-turn-helix domain-containing protein [Actinomadura kijaniata]
MKDDAEPVILDDPGKLKALSHPLRRRILRRLDAHGAATSTTLAEALGESTGTTSYHLRQLERHGLIEEIPERSAGRERWWRRAESPRDLRFPNLDAVPDEQRPVLGEVLRLMHAEDTELMSRVPEEYARRPEWVRVSRGSAVLTEEGLAEFFEDYIRLLQRHSDQAREAADPDARPVHVRLFTLPADGEE